MRFNIKDSEENTDILYRRPKWYPVKYDATGEVTKKIFKKIKNKKINKVYRISFVKLCFNSLGFFK